MADPTNQTGTPEASQTEASRAKVEALPSVRTGLTPAAVQSALETTARRGKLAGYAPVDERTFVVDGAGWLFEYTVTGNIDDAGTIALAMKRQLKGPIIVALVLAFTVEPGQYFMDQLIPGGWGWWPTWWWYYPLALLSIPLVWMAASKRSKLEALAYTGEQIESIAAATGGTIDAIG